jgi:hypothetical protein
VLVLGRDTVALRGAARGADVAVSYSYSYSYSYAHPHADSHPDADAVDLDLEPAPGPVACHLVLVVFPVRLVVLVRPRGQLTGVARVPC